MTASAVDSSLPANQSEIDLGEQDVHEDGADRRSRRGRRWRRRSCRPLAVSTPPATMSARPGDDDPALAEAPADDAAGEREEGAGQHVEADERAELRVAEPEIGRS